MAHTYAKLQRRGKRKLAIRNHVYGTKERPRMTVYRSNRYLSVQVIDDDTQHTLLALTSNHKDFEGKNLSKETAVLLGKKMGKELKKKKIRNIVFDRNGFLYHGVIKAFADSTREEGVKF